MFALFVIEYLPKPQSLRLLIEILRVSFETSYLLIWQMKFVRFSFFPSSLLLYASFELIQNEYFVTTWGFAPKVIKIFKR